jgi:hypothetical protein
MTDAVLDTAEGATDQEIVDRAIESNGDLVLDHYSRIGARPFTRFTPYRNNRGVRIHHWTTISISLKVMPERTLIPQPTVVDPHDYDDYPLRYFSTPWIRRQVGHSRGVKLVPAEETPFAGNAWDYRREDEK